MIMLTAAAAVVPVSASPIPAAVAVVPHRSRRGRISIPLELEAEVAGMVGVVGAGEPGEFGRLRASRALGDGGRARVGSRRLEDGVDDGEERTDEVVGEVGALLLELGVELGDGCGVAAELGDELGQHLVADADVGFEVGARILAFFDGDSFIVLVAMASLSPIVPLSVLASLEGWGVAWRPALGLGFGTRKGRQHGRDRLG